MSKESLAQIGTEAEAMYSQHKKAAVNVNSSIMLTRALRVLNEQPEIDSQEAVDDAAQILAEARREYDLGVSKATQFAEENAEGLYDQAVTEAHLHGVAINVEQPLSTDETIEAHKS